MSRETAVWFVTTGAAACANCWNESGTRFSTVDVGVAVTEMVGELVGEGVVDMTGVVVGVDVAAALG